MGRKSNAQKAAEAAAAEAAESGQLGESAELNEEQRAEMTEPVAPAGVAEVEGVNEDRPDDSQPGEQIDGHGLSPAVDDIANENDDADEQQPQNTPGAYLVAWDIKTGGKRYSCGQFVDLEDDVARPLLASGAIVPANVDGK